MGLRYLTGDELFDHKRFPVVTETDTTRTHYQYRVDDDTGKVLYAAVSYEKGAPIEVIDHCLSELQEKMHEVIREHRLGVKL